MGYKDDYRELTISICAGILLGAVIVYGVWMLKPDLDIFTSPDTIIDVQDIDVQDVASVDPSIEGSDWETLVTLLKHEEGFRAFAYPDTRGFWTIGYGTKLPLTGADKNCVNEINLSGAGPGLMKSQGDCLLRYRLSGHYNEIWKRWVPFHKQSEPVQMALLDMCYQLGVDGLLGFHQMLAALARHDYAAAIREAIDSAWDSETPSRVNRVVSVFRSQEQK